MPTMQHTIRFDETILFTDASGITFEQYRIDDDSLVDTSVSVNHARKLLPPAATILYDVEWNVLPVFGNNGVYVVFKLDSSLSNYVGVGDITYRLDSPSYAGEPIWSTNLIPSSDWVVGVDVSTYGNDLNNAIIQNGDVAGTVFTVDAVNSITPNAGNLPLGTYLNANGTFGGAAQTAQGGLYQMVFIATNKYGSSSATEVINLQVSLAVVNPTFEGLEDLSYARDEQITTLTMGSYLVSDGDPNKNQEMEYSIDPAGNNLPPGITLNSIGVLQGSVDSGAFIQDYVVIVRATNKALPQFFDTDTFTFSVTSAVATATPYLTAAYTGNAGCNSAVAPTWVAGDNEFFRAKSDTASTWTVDLNTFIANDGGSPVTVWAIASGTLPPNLTLDTATGIVSGSHDGTLASSPVTFTASNGNVSNPSPIYTWTVWDDTTSIPTLSGIDAQDGSSDVFVNFSEAVFIPNGTAADFELDFVFKVNNLTRNHTYIGGGSTSRLQYRLDGAAFSGGNTIDVAFTD